MHYACVTISDDANPAIRDSSPREGCRYSFIATAFSLKSVSTVFPKVWNASLR